MVSTQTSAASGYISIPIWGQVKLQLTWTQAKVSHQRGVAGTEAVRELGYECLQVLATLLRGVDVPEEIS